MRIVGGALRGRRLPGRPSAATRPTSDRVREAVASALQARGALEGARVLDLFAGTGALGLEALSRGAASLVAVDSDRAAIRCIADNARALGLGERVRALGLDLLGSDHKLAARLEQTGCSPFSLVFADPPYALAQPAVELLASLSSHGLLAPGAIILLEHAHKQPPQRPAGVGELATYEYGDTGIALWEAIASGRQT
jgi:16S rRNA (guanine966-N2)-methyltransferase